MGEPVWGRACGAGALLPLAAMLKHSSLSRVFICNHFRMTESGGEGKSEAAESCP